MVYCAYRDIDLHTIEIHVDMVVVDMEGCTLDILDNAILANT